MTTAEKAHAYDEALARANELYNRGYTSIPVDIFPELAESEDEKIRKELILFVKGNIQDEESEQRKDYLAWLEKQKPVWSEEDDEFLRRAINATKGVYPMTADWLKSIKERIKKGA